MNLAVPHKLPRPYTAYVYIFVRQDIPVAQQLVQSNHATLKMGSLYGYEGTPNIVLIGVANKEELAAVAGRCTEYQIPHHVWYEPDFDYGHTAIATAAIRGEKRQAFADYELWKFASVAQLAEQPVLSGSVEGSIPS